MEYDIDFFIKFYEDTKEEDWCIQRYICETGGDLNHAPHISRCAFGMIKYNKFGQLQRLDGDTEAEKMYLAIGRIFGKAGYYIAHVNDGQGHKVQKDFPQPTPRQRILAALHKFKELQNERRSEKNL